MLTRAKSTCKDNNKVHAKTKTNTSILTSLMVTRRQTSYHEMLTRASPRPRVHQIAKKYKQRQTQIQRCNIDVKTNTSILTFRVVIRRQPSYHEMLTRTKSRQRGKKKSCKDKDKYKGRDKTNTKAEKAFLLVNLFIVKWTQVPSWTRSFQHNAKNTIAMLSLSLFTLSTMWYQSLQLEVLCYILIAKLLYYVQV